MDYESLLKKAYEKLPKAGVSKERLKVPAADTSLQGNQTIIKNFSQIVETIRREPSHMLKFLAKELAAPAGIEGGRAVLQAKLSQRMVQQKIDAYMNEFVFCKECKSPDTKLIREDRVTTLKCEACGAKSPRKAIK